MSRGYFSCLKRNASDDNKGDDDNIVGSLHLGKKSKDNEPKKEKEKEIPKGKTSKTSCCGNQEPKDLRLQRLISKYKCYSKIKGDYTQRKILDLGS